MKVKIEPQNIVGKQYGKVVIEKYLGFDYRKPGIKYREHLYLCRCSCGNTAVAQRSQILLGKRKSCGHCAFIEKEDDYYRYHTMNGKTFIFDECDLALVKAHTWRINENGYALTSIGTKQVRLARLIFGITDRRCVDHIDGDRSNNRRSNLRVGSNSQNHGNQALNSRNTSGYKGVNFNRGRYRAYITKHKVTKQLGYFDIPEEAARAYDEAARFYFGEFACVNFPRPGEQSCRRNQEQAGQLEERKSA